MPSHSKFRLRRLPALALVATIAILGLHTGTAAASRPTHRIVVPPVDRIYDHLSVAWWKYALEQPTATNPLLDTTGAGCQTGQAGPVFFLVGTAGTGQVTRDQCAVPSGKFLYFPLVNAFDVHTPGDGLDTPNLVWNDLQNTLGFRVDSQYATVDGKSVQRLNPNTSPYRACAGPSRGCASAFSFNFPADNLFGLPAGTYAPAVADGFYLLLRTTHPRTAHHHLWRHRKPRRSLLGERRIPPTSPAIANGYQVDQFGNDHRNVPFGRSNHEAGQQTRLMMSRSSEGRLVHARRSQTPVHPRRAARSKRRRFTYRGPVG